MIAHIYNINEIMTDYAKLKITAEQIEKQMQEIRAAIQNYMENMELEELTNGEHKATYKEIERQTVKTSWLKDRFPDAARACTVTIASKRFTFA